MFKTRLSRRIAGAWLLSIAYSGVACMSSFEASDSRASEDASRTPALEILLLDGDRLQGSNILVDGAGEGQLQKMDFQIEERFRFKIDPQQVDAWVKALIDANIVAKLLASVKPTASQAQSKKESDRDREITLTIPGRAELTFVLRCGAPRPLPMQPPQRRYGEPLDDVTAVLVPIYEAIGAAASEITRGRTPDFRGGPAIPGRFLELPSGKR